MLQSFLLNNLKFMIRSFKSLLEYPFHFRAVLKKDYIWHSNVEDK